MNALRMAGAASLEPLPNKMDGFHPCRDINRSGTGLDPLRNFYQELESFSQLVMHET